MKLMIAADIHGSARYCGALLEAFGREQADRLLLLGDLLYHGPRNALPEAYDPPRVIAMLNGRKQDLLCVRGNCDTEVDQMVLQFPILADYALVCAGGLRLYATHGHIFHPDRLPPLQEGDILLYGHTHIPAAETRGSILCLNPGSVSIPKADSPHSFLLLEDGMFLWKTLEGTVFRQLRRESI
ncbi:MAG: phosphodiesterase [Clostridia bacterium]|nr:phosphodiesterase [Clostridia bacterium]